MSWQDVPCKEWSGYRNSHGYGRNGRHEYVHRVAWIEAHGPIPPETPFVLHHCDNPACYEVQHLFLGTQADNMRDMRAKGRSASTRKVCCPAGHPYDESNTYRRPDGAQGCRECLRAATRAWRARRKHTMELP